MKLLSLFSLFSVVVGHNFEVEHTALIAQSKGWVKGPRSSPAAEIKLVVAVKQQNVDLLEKKLLDVSNPLSPNYSKHMSNKEVHDLVAPKISDIVLTSNWLKGGKKDRVVNFDTMNGDFMSIRVTVQEAEALLSAEYYEFTHAVSGEKSIRLASGYTVPEHLVSKIDFVSPTTRFPHASTLTIEPKKNNLRSDVNAIFNTPSNLQGLYQTVGVEHDAKAVGNQVGFTNFIGQHYSNSDVEAFWKLYKVQATTILDKPANQTKGHGTESELDAQYLTAMAQGIPAVAYSNDDPQPGNPPNEAFLEWMIDVSNDPSPPFVYSVSYGEDEKSVNFDYATRCNTKFMKAGVRGISLLFASGDSGAGGNCTSGSGRLVPNFPVGSPYVTGVGGTVGGKAGAEPTGETVDSISGGGFSDYWNAIPEWQATAVNNYVANCAANKCPSLDNFNSKGRAYPDIAAQSENFLVLTYGIPLPVSGTSAACPTASGVIGLLNDARIAAGKKPLGFLNPFLYHAQNVDSLAFNDVVSGSNMGCSKGGFSAAKGWDPTTGLGTLNYKRLVAIALSLP